METALFLLILLTLFLIGLLIVLVLRLSPVLNSSQQQSLSQIKESILGTLSDQRSDYRDISASNSEKLFQTLQNSLTQQTMILEQRFESLQKQNDSRLNEIRSNVEKHLKENIEQNFGAFKEMSQSLSKMQSGADQMLKVGQQVEELSHILASPKLQGNFGEASLQQILSDVAPPGTYQWQPRLQDNSQPDAALKIKGLLLCIDAKFPKDRIASLMNEAQTEEQIQQARKELSRVIRDMIADISKKYVRPDLGTTDQAFLFVPSETLYYEILKLPEVTEHSRKYKVTVVSPNTLAATLYAVALAFRGYEIQENTRHILSGIQDMKRHFNNFCEDFQKIGQRIKQTQDQYESASHDLKRFDKTINQIQQPEPSPVHSIKL